MTVLLTKSLFVPSSGMKSNYGHCRLTRFALSFLDKVCMILLTIEA